MGNEGSNSGQALAIEDLIIIHDYEDRLAEIEKNLAEIDDIKTRPVPDDENGRELRDIRQVVERAFAEAPGTFMRSDRPRALALTEQGRGTAQRCDGLVARVSHSDYSASTTAALILGARHYKRINGHLLNVLSAVVMPVFKVDYYDEDEIPAFLNRA